MIINVYYSIKAEGRERGNATRIQRMSQEVDGPNADLTLRRLQTQSTLLHSLKEISQRLDVFIPVLRVAYYVIYLRNSVD